MESRHEKSAPWRSHDHQTYAYQQAAHQDYAHRGQGGGDEEWYPLVGMVIIGAVILLAKIIGTEKERARVNELDRKHQQMRADIQSGRWRNQ